MLLMKQSALFTKTRKEAPKDEVSLNAKLLIRGGFIHKRMAGVYEYLPLGFLALNNIMTVIREEMDAVGGQEMKLSALQDKATWETTGRWDDEKIPVWFKTKLKEGTELGLGFTHEEPLTELMREHIFSYKDLPVYAYQFQTKFRNEERAKSGIMRTREFVMKDLYSFSRNEEEHKIFYEQCAGAYRKIFNRLGIGERTYRTFASGGVFSTYSDEFQTLSDAGEDIIYIDEAKGIAVNKEVYTDEVLADVGLEKENLKESRSVEVGNIFSLGTRFSDAFNLVFKDENGEQKPAVMGSYGIGPARLMGVIVETLADEKGIIWPPEAAPFRFHLLDIGGDDKVKAYADDLYRKLTNAGVSILYDDRNLRAGEKFADSDLIGIPKRIVVSKKTLESKMIESVERKTGAVSHISESELLRNAV